MLRISFVFALVILGIFQLKAQIVYDWGNWIGPGGEYQIYKIRIDAEGNHYICGYFKDQLDLDPSEASVIITAQGAQENGFVAKYSPQGQLIWHHTILSNGIASVGDVAINSEGNVLITCWVQGLATLPGYGSYTVNGANDAVLISFDANGSFRWARGLSGTITSGLDVGLELATDSQGNFYAMANIGGSSVRQTIGSTTSYLFMPSGFFSGIAISKWNDAGVLQYMTGVSSNNPRFTVNSQGEVFLSFPASQFTFGSQQGESYGTTRLLAAKINTDGTLAWYRNLANGNNVRSFGMATDGDNAYVTLSILGSEGDFVSNGGKDLGVAKLNGSTGNMDWVRNIGSTSADDEGRSLAFSPEGSLWVTGFFRGELDADPSPLNAQLVTSRGSTDLILWELDTLGNYQSHYALGGSNGDEGRFIIFDRDGNLLLIGYTANLRTGDFDPGPANRPITDNVNAFSGYFTARYTPGTKVSIGPDIVQCGGSVTLTAEPSGYDYLWFNGATTQSITFFTSVNAYVEVYENNVLLGTDTAYIIIDNSTSAELGEDQNVFFQVTLEPTVLGDNYLWSTGETSRSITVNTSGTYSLQMDNVNGCPLYDEIEVIIQEPDIYLGGIGDGSGYVQEQNQQNSYFLSGQSDGFYAITYNAPLASIFASSQGDGFNIGSFAQIDSISIFRSGFSDGSFSQLILNNNVSLFASGSGDGFSSSKISSIINALDKGIIKSAAKIYPNPARDFLHIDYQNIAKTTRFDILDLKGNMILSGNLNAKENKIQLPKMAVGIYLVCIYLEKDIIEYSKLVKK